MDMLGKHKHSAANHSNSQRRVVKRPNVKCGKPNCWSGTGVGMKSLVPEAERQHHHFIQGCRASSLCFGGRTCSHLLSLFLSTPLVQPDGEPKGELVVRLRDCPDVRKSSGSAHKKEQMVTNHPSESAFVKQAESSMGRDRQEANFPMHG